MNCKLIVTDVTDIGDPFVLNYKGVYYMYATSSKEGFKVWKSLDLKNWRDCGLCYFKQDSFGYMDFWAPEVTVRKRRESSKSRALMLSVSLSFRNDFRKPISSA